MATAPYDMTVQPDDEGVPVLAGLNRAREVIAMKESGGDYSIIGPRDPKSGSRPIGRYQVMEFNIAPWTKEVFGKAMTPEEFRASPQAQDAVFNAKFGQYAKKYGNFADAASMWHSGRPRSKSGKAKDVLGTRTSDYVRDFERLYGTPGPLNVRSFTSGGNGPLEYDPLGIAQTQFADSEPNLGDAVNSVFQRPAQSFQPITKPSTSLWGGDMLASNARQRVRNA